MHLTDISFFPFPCLRSPVYLSAVPNLDDNDDQLIFLDGIDEAVISDSDPVEFINPSELLDLQ